jgi:hypothetical protein
MAGVGKSTVSMTISQYFLSLRRLGAFLRFDEKHAGSCDPTAVIHALSYQLAQFHPLIKEAIIQRLLDNPGVTNAPLSVQFEELLRRPMESVRILASEGPIVVVIDGLDECGDAASRVPLLQVLSTELANLPPYFRFLITSRNVHNVNSSLSQRTFEPRLLNMASNEDIMRYLQHSLNPIMVKTLSGRRLDEWLDNTVSQFVGLAEGSFIRASMMVEIFRSGEDSESPTLVHSPSFHQRLDVEMSVLYAHVLEQSVNWTDPVDAATCRAALGAIVAVHKPVAGPVLERLLEHEVKDGAVRALDWLGGVIHQELGSPIQLLHHSLTEYLCSRDQCGDRPWFIDSVTLHDSHSRLAHSCFGIMKDGLCYNICGAKSSFLRNSDLSSDAIPPELAYATQHWAHHLQSSSYNHKLLVDVDYLISTQFLYWLEVLSFLESIPIAVPSLLRAVKWIRVRIHFITSMVCYGWTEYML